MSDIAKRLRWLAVLSGIAAVALPVMLGAWSWAVSVGLLLAAWIIATSACAFWSRVRNAPGVTLAAKLRGSAPRFYGMLLAHVGVAIFVIGVTLVRGYGTEKDVRMEAGETVELAGYVFRFVRIAEINGPNYVAARATIEVARDGNRVATMYPEKRVYAIQRMPMTEAAIDRGLARDLYVALGEAVTPTAWVVRVQHKPFVNWIWGGCLIMALGGVLAAADRRYRVAPRAAARSPAERTLVTGSAIAR